MTINQAAYLTAAKAYPLEVRTAPLGKPGPRQILFKNSAVAINPIDTKLQKLAIYPIDYPAILGEDVAGIVESIGSEVTRFQPGDRVIGTTAGSATKDRTANTFQEYTILESNLSARIPDILKFEDAVQLPLAITTAAAGLFNEGHLALQLPAEPARQPSGKIVLVWGGASSVGLAAIQFAKAAGYRVITTCSPKNFDLVKKVGAEYGFDYNSASVVGDILANIGGTDLAGVYDAVGKSAWAPCVEIAQKASGAKKVTTAVRGFPEPPEGVEMTRIFSLSIKDNGVGRAVWEDFVQSALQAGTLVPASEVLVAGKGLESIQGGLDLLSKGVSAQKVVVKL